MWVQFCFWAGGESRTLDLSLTMAAHYPCATPAFGSHRRLELLTSGPPRRSIHWANVNLMNFHHQLWLTRCILPYSVSWVWTYPLPLLPNSLIPKHFFSDGERIPLQGMCRWMDSNQRKRVILTLSLTLIPDRVTGSFPKPDTLPSELHPHLEQVSRIELPSPAWQAGTLNRCAIPAFWAEDGVRTRDP